MSITIQSIMSSQISSVSLQIKMKYNCLLKTFSILTNDEIILRKLVLHQGKADVTGKESTTSLSSKTTGWELVMAKLLIIGLKKPHLVCSAKMNLIKVDLWLLPRSG